MEIDIEDEPHSGCPIKVECDQLKQTIDQGRNVATQTIVLEFDVNQNRKLNDPKCINLHLSSTAVSLMN